MYQISHGASSETLGTSVSVFFASHFTMSQSCSCSHPGSAGLLGIDVNPILLPTSVGLTVPRVPVSIVNASSLRTGEPHTKQ